MSNDWGTADPPGFTVQRITEDGAGGDFVRGLPSARQNAIRYRVRTGRPAEVSAKVAIKSSLTATTTGYGAIDLSWSWPPDYSDWTEVAIVRSGFGHPSTVTDGVTVFRSKQSEYEFFQDLTALTITITDDELQEGRWFYYTLFFYKTTWEAVMYAEALTPRNYGHYEHLWRGLPEYYRWVDGRYRGEEGYAQQFLKMFGFELDLTREYIESWQEVYNVDNSPQPLLYQVGLNLGVDTTQSLGEIRTRALIGQINQLYEKRGTSAGLKAVIEAASKYDTEVSNGRNMLLLPDDSEFLTGSGNWVLSQIGVPVSAAPMPSAGRGIAFDAAVTATGTTPLVRYGMAYGQAFDARLRASATPSYVQIVAPYNTGDKAANAGKNVMTVISTAPPTGYFATNDLSITCGLGQSNDRTLTPKYNGVPVEQNILYGFSCRVKTSRLTSTITAGIYWFDRNELFLGSSSSAYPATGSWQTVLVQGLSFYSNNGAVTPTPASGYGQAFNPTITVSTAFTAGSRVGYAEGQSFAFDAAVVTTEYRPIQADNARRTVYSEYAGAAYAVPYITVSNRQTGDDFRVMGCMFYEVGPGGTTTAVAPDFYLTLGSGEVIGDGTGKVMGG